MQQYWYSSTTSHGFLICESVSQQLLDILQLDSCRNIKVSCMCYCHILLNVVYLHHSVQFCLYDDNIITSHQLVIKVCFSFSNTSDDKYEVLPKSSSNEYCRKRITISFSSHCCFQSNPLGHVYSGCIILSTSPYITEWLLA